MTNWRMWLGWGVTLVVFPILSAKMFGVAAIWPWFSVLAGAYFCASIVYGFESVHRVISFAVHHPTSNDVTPLVKYLVLMSRHNRPHDHIEWQGPMDPVVEFAIKLHREKFLPKEEAARLIHQKAHSMAERWTYKTDMISKMAQWPMIFGLACAFITLMFGFMKLDSSPIDWAQDSYIMFGMMSVVAGLCCSYLLFAPIMESFREGARYEILKSRLVAQALPLIVQGSHPIMVLEELNSLLSGTEIPPWSDVLEAMKDKAA